MSEGRGSPYGFEFLIPWIKLLKFGLSPIPLSSRSARSGRGGLRSPRTGSVEPWTSLGPLLGDLCVYSR